MSSASNAIGKPQSKWVSYLLHGLSGLVGLAFLMAGGTKLAGVEMHVENFLRWGYPNWFMYVTGSVELLGAVLIVIPRTRFYGAVLLLATMVGAILTHIQANKIGAIPVPFVLLVLAGFVGWMNRPVSENS